MATSEITALVMYTLLLALPLLYLFDRHWTVWYSLSKDVRIIQESDYTFHLERRMVLFRRYVELRNIPRTTKLDEILDIYNKIQKGKWGKKLVINTKEL